jgi:rubrerythrin
LFLVKPESLVRKEEMSDLISSLRASFGEPPDTSTIEGIKAYTELWVSGEQGADSVHLLSAYQEMIDKLVQAVLDTEAELAQTGQTDESLAQPVGRSIQAYQQLQDILKELKKAVSEHNFKEARSLLSEMQEAANFLKEAQQDLTNWVRRDVLRCPRCGGTGQDPCPSCGLVLMSLDPSGGVQTHDSPMDLPPEFGDLYSAVLAIRDGKLSLTKLGQALPKVEKNVNSFLASVQAASKSTQQESQNLVQGEACLQEMKAGLHRLRDTLNSRSMIDLQQGWIQLFKGASRLQEIRRSLLREFGGEQGREVADREEAFQTKQDSVSWSNDD